MNSYTVFFRTVKASHYSPMMNMLDRAVTVDISKARNFIEFDATEGDAEAVMVAMREAGFDITKVECLPSTEEMLNKLAA